ncbi:MAG: hypothetical protein ACRDRE_12100 [Pseudonocardiaceae bacterium]
MVGLLAALFTNTRALPCCEGRSLDLDRRGSAVVPGLLRKSEGRLWHPATDKTTRADQSNGDEPAMHGSCQQRWTVGGWRLIAPFG